MTARVAIILECDGIAWPTSPHRIHHEECYVELQSADRVEVSDRRDIDHLRANARAFHWIRDGVLDVCPACQSLTDAVVARHTALTMSQAFDVASYAVECPVSGDELAWVRSGRSRPET